MSEYVFPEIQAHCATVSGQNLIFSPGIAPPLSADDAAFDLVKHCPGMSVNESQEWLRQHYGDAHVGAARYLAQIVDDGYFAVPRPGPEECNAVLSAPTNFGICITHRCNMRCRYCFATHLRQADEPEDISLDTARAAVDYVFDVLQPPWVDFSLGITGEPQLKWDMVEYVADHARSRSEECGTGVRFHVTTNGLQLSPRMLDYLRHHDDVGITLSWDGPPAVHDSQRMASDGAGTYDRVSKAFEALVGVVKTRPAVVATFCAPEPDIAGAFSHLFDRGVRDLTLKPTRSVGPAMAVTEQSLPAYKAAYSKLADLLLTADQFQAERLFTLAKDDSLGRYIVRIAYGKHFLYRCPGGRSSYDVDTNGDIYPCASLVGVEEFRMGNVRTGLDERMKQVMLVDTSLPNLQACSDCWAKYYCGGVCAYVSALTCGKIDKPYGPDCELTRYLVELAGYIVAKLNTERPGLLAEVLALRTPVPMGRRPSASCKRAPEGGLWTCPAEAWEVADPIVLASKMQAGGCKRWRGPSDCSAAIHMKWDEDYLYLMAEVTDHDFVPPASREGEWWSRDSIQFALDPENDGTENVYPWKLPEGDYEYGVAWVDGAACVYDCQVDPLRPSRAGDARVTREGDRTTYRVAIPWKHIRAFTPSVGSELGFSVVVNDCDGGARGWMQWTHGLATRKAPASFGRLRLVE